MKPFLKWAGGKRWLVESGQFSVPRFSGRYIEPFLGGGAIFFSVQPAKAILSDTNERLMEVYEVIRDNVVQFESLLMQHGAEHSEKYYYEERMKQYETRVERAAQFTYLNRTCWNGLYRENLQGHFNVPLGTKQKVIMSNDDFPAWSRALKGIVLARKDFEAIMDAADEGDFIFVDPPYSSLRQATKFIKYNKKIFDWEDQLRLRRALGRAAGRGVKFALTNLNQECVRDLYSGFGNHILVTRHSVIAGKSMHRARCSELLITS